jgi:hypothetical protein
MWQGLYQYPNASARNRQVRPIPQMRPTTERSSKRVMKRRKNPTAALEARNQDDFLLLLLPSLTGRRPGAWVSIANFLDSCIR